MKYIMRSHIFGMALCAFYIASALKIDLQGTGLTGVPQDINPLVSDLDLDENNIVRITRTTFASYKELRKLSLRDLDLKYIEEGSFDHNSKLKKLSLRKNSISQLPQTFGPAEPNLLLLDLWSAIDKEALSVLSFREMIRLETLYVGDMTFPGYFDAALLPPTLQYINLNHAHLIHFPEFPRHTPNISKLYAAFNEITEIPPRLLVELSVLGNLDLKDNKLSTIPDMYHLPLETLQLSKNPLVCNQSLCWIRMWPWARTRSLDIDDIACKISGLLNPVLLTDVNPVTLGCHHGTHYSEIRITRIKDKSTRYDRELGSFFIYNCIIPIFVLLRGHSDS